MSDLNPFEEMDAINALLGVGTEQGYITYDQILEALPDIEENISLLEAIMEEAQNLNIAIYENEEDAVSGEEGSEVETASELVGKKDDEKDDKSHAAPLFDLSNVPIDDSVGLYFREMGQQSLLSAEEEVQLAKEIEAGRDSEERLQEEEETLTLDDRDEIANVIAMGDAARAHLIRANTRLVVMFSLHNIVSAISSASLVPIGALCCKK